MAARRTISQPTELNGTYSTITSKVIELVDTYGFSVQADYVDDAPAAVTVTSDTVEVQTLTFPAKASITDRDYIVVYDSAGVSYAVYADKTGTSIAPTGAAYLAATYKVKANISADTTDVEVAARFETAFNTLTGFTAAITTDDTAADGTMLLTQVVAGPTTNPVPKNLGDTTAGTLEGVQTTAGAVDMINLTDDEVTITAHGLVTGTKFALTTSAADLPSGLTATNYWAIKVDADTLAFAESLALATAGTRVALADGGTGIHTLTPTTAAGNVFKMQKSNDGTTWTDVSSMTVTTATSTVSTWFEVANPTYKYIKLLYTPAAGQANLVTTVCQKGC